MLSRDEAGRSIADNGLEFAMLYVSELDRLLAEDEDLICSFIWASLASIGSPDTFRGTLNFFQFATFVPPASLFQVVCHFLPSSCSTASMASRETCDIALVARFGGICSILAAAKESLSSLFFLAAFTFSKQLHIRIRGAPHRQHPPRTPRGVLEYLHSIRAKLFDICPLFQRALTRLSWGP